MGCVCYTLPCSAGVAHLVERHLAKVEVAGSSPVARSRQRGRSKLLLPLFAVGTDMTDGYRQANQNWGNPP